ncbi:hypothetical protein QM012_001129 [Aureobasidium pullulans]|uniref:Uncharacterized protein n=1 Tax=Aureobasidium pullulans TaxID=5580 RepID=A0ABR0TFS6_AURPU
MTFKITASLSRALLAVLIFLLGFKTCEIVNRPLPLTHDLSTLLSNQTLTLELPGHVETPIATAYVPISLYDHGRASVFWCALLALGCAGGYIVDKVQYHVLSHLVVLHSEASRVPKGESFWFYAQGVKSIRPTAWVNATGPRDTFMAWTLSVTAVAGALYPVIITGIQSLASDNVTERLRLFLSSSAANNAIFGEFTTDGSYTLETWTCQIAPLISSSADAITSTRSREILSQSCQDGRTSRFLLLIMLPLTLLMLFSIARPHWLTFTFGAEERPVWMAVPHEEHDKDLDSENDDDNDPLVHYRRVLVSRVRAASASQS